MSHLLDLFASFLSSQTSFFLFLETPIHTDLQSGLAFSSVTSSCEGNSLVSLRPARVSKGVGLEQVRLPSKDCPLEVAAGAATRSAGWWLHIPGLNALFCVIVGRWGESLVQVWKHHSSDMVSCKPEKDHSEKGVDTDLFWYLETD